MRSFRSRSSSSRREPFPSGPLAFAITLAGAACLAGCPAFHQSPGARLQEAATELNVNTRFGRMEIATENVAPGARVRFLERRQAWGDRVRVADYELAGVHMLANDADAETYVKVAWYKIDRGDLHQTTLKQSWHAFKGDWKLVDEERKDGDIGLMNEPASLAATSPTPLPTNAWPASSTKAQFPTIRLGAAPAEAAPATILPPERAD